MATAVSNPVLLDYPDTPSNVFLMMRFRDSPQNREIFVTLQDVLEEYSLTLIRADHKQWLPELWPNIKACMEASALGIAVFAHIDDRDVNPNVSIELGYMLARDKPCLLLKEKRVPTLQADPSQATYTGNLTPTILEPQCALPPSDGWQTAGSPKELLSGWSCLSATVELADARWLR